MFGLGVPEMVVVFFAILLLFGAKSLPEIAKGLGKGIRLFKKELRDISDDVYLDDEKQAKSDDEKRDWRKDIKS